MHVWKMAIWTIISFAGEVQGIRIICKCIVMYVLREADACVFSAMSKVAVHWFRHGLRLHDNPALLDALEDAKTFYAIFIFDGESAGVNAISI